MRTYSVVLLVLAGIPTVGSASILRDPDRDVTAERVAGLIKQLGDPKFARREAAFKELVAIGEPTLDALRKASASTDPEVRTRAERAVDSINARACERELARLDGYWKTADGAWLEINGDRWSSGTPTWGPARGRIWVVEVGKSLVAADMFVEDGPTRGLTCLAIYWREGDRLRYCGTYTAVRAKDFKAPAGYYAAEFNRGKK
jgi:hypothetical protein